MAKRKGLGSPHLKIVGMVPASDEERIHLMKTVLHFTDEKARASLEEMNERKPPYIKIEEEDEKPAEDGQNDGCPNKE